MLEIPNLDCQTFQEIVSGAVKKIQSIYPEWTDYNEHDPGITILELFSWLKEMEQYYINRMTKRSIESLLGLLDCRPLPALPSRASILFNTKAQKMFLKGETFYSEGGVAFEVLQNSEVGQIFVENVLLFLNGSIVNVLEGQLSEGIGLEVFGSKDPIENYFQIGFTFAGDDSFQLFFKVLDDYPIKRNRLESGSNPGRQLIWEYAVNNRGAIDYKELKIISDETSSLSFSGSIIFKTPEDFKEVSLFEGQTKYWLRCILVDPGCEERPVISKILGSRVRLIQRETLCENQIFGLTDSNNPVIQYGYARPDDRFLLFEEKREGSWRLVHDFHFAIDLKGLASVTIPKTVKNKTMVVKLKGEVSGKSVLQLKGYPGQVKAQFLTKEGLIESELSLLVKNEFGDYEVWNYRKHIDEAGPYDKCFSYDGETGDIIFGDNENGEMPLVTENPVIVISCIATLGRKGIVSENAMLPVELGINTSSVKPEMIYDVYGENKENVQDAAKRFRDTASKLRKTVSLSDYEQIALETPGRRVICAKAIPCYDDSKPDKYSESTVTIIALPYSGAPKTMPDDHFIMDVHNYLDRHRTVTTKIIVEKPVFIGINIYCETIVGGSYDKQKIKAEIEGIIEDLFNIKSHHDSYKIGREIKESDIIIKISTVDGVFQTRRLMVNSDSNNVSRDSFGNIRITETMVPYLNELELTCRSDWE